MINFFKKILSIPLSFLNLLRKGLLFLSLLLSRGFYFYVVCFFKLIRKIIPISKIDKLIVHFEKRKEQPEFVLVLVLWCVSFIALFGILYSPDDQIVNHDDLLKDEVVSENTQQEDVKKEEVLPEDDPKSPIVTDMNPFRIYGKTSLNSVNFSYLKGINSDTVAWLSVDRTNINYPIVQTTNNDFYLDHTFDKSFKKTGWTFMDYRNSPDMSDDNTIFYGHNLLNGTSFGSVGKIFLDNWASDSNRSIVVLIDGKKYFYEIFSAYYIDPEIYYLQTNFNTLDEKANFIHTLKKRNIINIDVSITTDDKIITLSTCTEDNKGRKVVHAKLIN